jgi:hypothetical protein
MAAKWNNPDGLGVKFGNYVSDPRSYVNRFRQVNTDGPVKIAVMDVDLTRVPAGGVFYPADLNNDGTYDGFNEGDFNFAPYTSILRVTYLTRVAAAGGTSITVGTYAKTGAAQTATGLMTATEGVLANLDTIGARVYGAGAFVAATAETASVGAAAAFPSIAATGTFSAGQGLLIVEYVTPFADVSST